MAPSINPWHDLVSDRCIDHKESEDYLNGGEKPTFDTAGPEESRFLGKACTEVIGNDCLESLPCSVKRKRSAGHAERKKRRASSEAKGLVLGDDEVYPCDPAMDSNDENLWPGYDFGPSPSHSPESHLKSGKDKQLGIFDIKNREKKATRCKVFFFKNGKRCHIGVGTSCVWVEEPRRSSPGPASTSPDMIDKSNETPSDGRHKATDHPEETAIPQPTRRQPYRTVEETDTI